MHLVQAVLKDLPASPAEKSYNIQCGVAEAGLLVYAPGESDPSAILNSRAIFGNAHAKNATTCITIVTRYDSREPKETCITIADKIV